MHHNKSSLDSLYVKVARKVLTDSLALRKGETVTVETWETGLDFARHIMVEARRIGAIPLTIFENEDAYVKGVRLTPRDMTGQMGRHEYALLANTDAYVFIPGPAINVYSRRLTGEEVASSIRYNQSWYDAAAKAKVRGARLTFGYIGEKAPSLLRKSIDSIIVHQLKAALVDYKPIRDEGRRIADLLSSGTRATVTTTNCSRLELTTSDYLEIQDGIIDEDDIARGTNVMSIPPGNVYVGTDQKSASGKFTSSSFVTRYGLIRDATLEFSEGQLVKWSSPSSQKALNGLVEHTPDSRKFVSLLSVGLNPSFRYGYGQDWNPRGVIGIRCLGLNITAKKASLEAAGKQLVSREQINLE